MTTRNDRSSIVVSSSSSSSSINSNYNRIEKLGRGGFGEVWLAEDTRTGALVALKRMESSDSLDREVVMLEKCRGIDGIPQLIECGTNSIVMELVDGLPLNERLKEGRMSKKILDTWTIELVRIVSELHKRGVIHRDIKLNNIMIDKDNKLWLVDLGLAITCNPSTGISCDKSAAGTHGYMSLQQENGINDVKNDVYSISVVVYIMYHAGMGYLPRKIKKATRKGSAHKANKRIDLKTFMRIVVWGI